MAAAPHDNYTMTEPLAALRPCSIARLEDKPARITTRESASCEGPRACLRIGYEV